MEAVAPAIRVAGTISSISPTMSKPQKIGGEYGDVRASIDVDNLNAYIHKNVPVIKTPVDVKQFKVRQTRNVPQTL